jgi:RHS repeat-associated protein
MPCKADRSMLLSLDKYKQQQAVGCPALTYNPTSTLRVAHRGKSLTPKSSGAGSQSAYLYGFQNQEKDNEIYGAEGTSYAFEYRMHDARVGRFLSIDPLVGKYPYWSPYAFSGNRVIDKVELEGLEPASPPSTWNTHQDRGDFYGQGSTVMQVSDAGSVEKWWVTKAVKQNGNTTWMYYEPDLRKWSNWIPNGYSEAGPNGAPVAANGRAQMEARAQGRADAEAGNTTALSKGLLSVTMMATTAGVGGKGFDILLEGAQQLAVNGGDWGNLDLVDMAGAALPSGADVAVSAAFDLTPSGKWQSVFGEKSIIDAAIEGGWGLAGKLVTGGDNFGSHGAQRIVNTTTGVSEKLGSDLVKGAMHE